MEHIKPVPFEDWTPDISVPLSPRPVSAQIPFEDWTPRTFVPFSPRHVSVQTETDLPLQYPYSFASQQATDFVSDVAGQLSSQQCDDNELELIKNAIDMEVQNLMSKCFPPAGITGNTCTSCNANIPDDDKSTEYNASSADCMSDSDWESVPEKHTESLLGIDVCSPSLKNGTDSFTASKRTCTSYCGLDLSCDNQTNSAFTVPSKCDDNMSKQVNGQPDLSNDCTTDNQLLVHRSVGTQWPCEPHSTASCDRLLTDTQSEQQSAKSESRHPSNTSLRKKNKKTVSTGELAAASRSESWQVINISERCSLYTYKQEILHQHMPVYHATFLRQVSLLTAFLLHINSGLVFMWLLSFIGYLTLLFDACCLLFIYRLHMSD